MEKYYTIGETAKIMNITSKALRNYDHLDLLKPSYLDPITKYRYYTYDQFFTIDIIKYLNKILHIPLVDIKQLLYSTTDYEHTCELLNMHRQSIKQLLSKYEYTLHLIDNMMEDLQYKSTIPETASRYEVYLMSRNFYYIELNAPLCEIDKYINRSFTEFIQTKNLENDTISLLFSREDSRQRGELIIKGFGLFSSERISGLKMKKFEDGRYLINRFRFSEAACQSALDMMIDYAQMNNMRLDDECLLTSKTVDLTAKTKYDYDMELQMLHYLN